jgi:hypothetical protein
MMLDAHDAGVMAVTDHQGDRRICQGAMKTTGSFDPAATQTLRPAYATLTRPAPARKLLPFDNPGSMLRIAPE